MSSINNLSYFQSDKFNSIEKTKSESDVDKQVYSILVDRFKNNSKVITYIETHQGKIHSMIQELKRASSSNTVNVKKLFNEVIKAQKEEGLIPPKSAASPNKVVSISWFCDLSAPDHNGAILGNFCNSLKDGQPSIVSRSILRSSELCSPETIKARDVLLQTIEQQFDIYTKNGYLVFLPKGEHLEKFDFDPEGFVKITLKEAWEQKEEKLSMEGFMGLFSPRGDHPKAIYLSGHGDVGSGPGMSGGDYRNFLGWVQHQKCAGLMLSSCYSGGLSSLEHLPESNKGGVDIPVFVQSVGDTVTRGSRNDIQKVVQFIEQSGPQTKAKLRKILNQSANNVDLLSHMQVYFPSTGGSPAGFSLVGEGDKTQSLTYGQYIKAKHEGAELSVDREALDVSPVVIDCPIHISVENPLIFSAIPGNAHHFFKDVKVETQFESFIESNVGLHRDNELMVEKVLYISHLECEDASVEQVLINLKDGSYYFCFDGKYFFKEANTERLPKKVTPFEYYVALKKDIISSTPDPKALHYAVNGQQSENDFMEALESSFDEDQKALFKTYDEILESIEVKGVESASQLQQIIDTLGLKGSEIITLLASMLPSHEEVISDFLRTSSVSPDLKDSQGIPLVVHTAKNHCLELMKVLIEKGADLNSPSPSQDLAITVALSSEDKKMVELLLDQPTLDLTVTGPKDNPIIYFAVSNAELLEKLLPKVPKQSLNVPITMSYFPSMNLLSACVTLELDVKNLQLLIDAGAGFDRFSLYSPLSTAILMENREKIEFFLSKGEDPFRDPKGGLPPIVYAMRYSPVSLVERLLQIPFNELEKNSLNEMFAAAIESGEVAKIQLLPDVKVDLLHLYPEQLRGGIEKLVLFGELEFLRESALMRQEPMKSFFIESLMKLAPEKVLEYATSDEILSVITRNARLSHEECRARIDKFLKPSSKEDYQHILTHYILNPPYEGAFEEPFIKWLVEKGVDIHAEFAGTTLFKEIVRNQKQALYQLCLSKPETVELLKDKQMLQECLRSSLGSLMSPSELMVKDLVERGADMRDVDPFSEGWETIFYNSPMEFIDYCLQHGARFAENPKLMILTLDRLPEGWEIFKKIVEGGGDINITDENLPTPLSKVLLKGDLEKIEFCLKAGTKLKGKQVEEAFLSAFRSKKPEMINILLREGYKFSMKDWDKETMIKVMNNISIVGGAEMVERMVNFELPPQEMLYINSNTVNRIRRNSPELYLTLIAKGFSEAP